MIIAGVILLSIGVTDLLRQFVPARRRWIAYLAAAVVLLLASAAIDAVPAAIVGALVAAGWAAVVAPDGAGRTGVGAAAAVAVICAVAVLAVGPRADPAPLAEVWHPAGPAGPVAIDTLVVAVGAAVFLLESGNVVVRSALRGERVLLPADGTGLKGGRLIGPLERVLVFALTLAGAYTLLAAVLAAKGIVRFPEISRDGESGNRAEYFLVGSLVSWAAALGAALLVWWGSAS